jgi:hypothetical protein
VMIGRRAMPPGFFEEGATGLIIAWTGAVKRVLSLFQSFRRVPTR